MTAPRPEVSVIMANFNGARFIGEAVRSVQRQTLAFWELIVVDDGSSDQSVQICLDLAAADPRLRVVIQPANLGPAAARNRALDLAEGAWIAILDSDDAMAPRRLERLLVRARWEGAEIAADNQTICSHDLRPEAPFLQGRFARPGSVDLAQFIESGRLYSGRPDLGYLKPLISRALIARTGARYDEGLRIGEDFHFLLRLLRAGGQIAIEPEPLYLYRKHAASVSHRLTPAVLAAMIAADEAFRAEAPPLAAAAARALDRRIAGLKSWQAHEGAVSAFKAGRPLAALGLALNRPHAWPLMAAPLQARIRRWMHGSETLAAPIDTAFSAEGKL